MHSLEKEIKKSEDYNNHIEGFVHDCMYLTPIKLAKKLPTYKNLSKKDINENFPVVLFFNRLNSPFSKISKTILQTINKIVKLGWKIDDDTIVRLIKCNSQYAPFLITNYLPDFDINKNLFELLSNFSQSKKMNSALSLYCIKNIPIKILIKENPRFSKKRPLILHILEYSRYSTELLDHIGSIKNNFSAKVQANILIEAFNSCDMNTFYEILNRFFEDEDSSNFLNFFVSDDFFDFNTLNEKGVSALDALRKRESRNLKNSNQYSDLFKDLIKKTKKLINLIEINSLNSNSQDSEFNL